MVGVELVMPFVEVNVSLLSVERDQPAAMESFPLPPPQAASPPPQLPRPHRPLQPFLYLLMGLVLRPLVDAPMAIVVSTSI